MITYDYGMTTPLKYCHDYGLSVLKTITSLKINKNKNIFVLYGLKSITGGQ